MLILLACEPCDDCGKPLQYDPNVRFRFINFDSLIKLDTALSETTDSLNQLAMLEDSLRGKVSNWNSLMNAYRDSIANGQNQYAGDTVKITDSLSIATQQLIDIDTSQLYTNTYEDLLIEARKFVLSGNVLVNSITIMESGHLITYEDSAEVYSVPLLLQGENQTNFTINLADNINTIGFSYDTEVTQDVERYIRLRATNIDTINVTFDSLYFQNCIPPDCKDNEIFVVIYF